MTGRAYPFRPPTRFQGKAGLAALDQVRVVDKSRLTRKVGSLEARTAALLLQRLIELFSLGGAVQCGPGRSRAR